MSYFPLYVVKRYQQNPLWNIWRRNILQSIPFRAVSLARDYFYFSAFLLGVTLSVFSYQLEPYIRGLYRRLSKQKINGSYRKSLFLLPFLLVLLAFAVSFLCVAFIYSDASLFATSTFLWPALAITLVSALCLRFPRFVGYPSLVALGAIVALSAYFFLSFPELKPSGDVLASLRSESSGNSWLRFDAGWPGKARQFRPIEGTGLLTVRAIRIDFDQRYPFVGGSSRVALSSCSYSGAPALQSDWGLPSASLGSLLPVGTGVLELFPGVLITGMYANFDTKGFLNGQRLLLMHKDAKLFIGALSEFPFF